MVTIKVASAMTGLTVKSIRFYEDEGLFRPSARSAGGYRLYSEEDIRQLQQIRLYRDLNFSLKEIADLLDAATADNLCLFQAQLDKVNQKKQEYERISRLLSRSIDSIHQARNKPLDKGSVNSKGVAIIAIDLQNDLLPGGAMPCLRILSLIEPLTKLFAAARQKDVPIVYVCDYHYKGVDKELNIWEDHMLAGTWGAEIIEELTPGPGDVVVKKSCFNSFFQTGLQDVLDRMRAETLIFVGFRSHVCIAQSAIEAFHRGYRVLIAVDGVTSTTKEEHEFALRMLEVNYGFEMHTCEQILAVARNPKARLDASNGQQEYEAGS